MTAPVIILQRRADLVEPHDCTDAADDLTILSAVCDTLVRRMGQGFAPHLATGWSVSDDACRWEFTLRAGVLFQDGSPCDADAVAQSLRRMARADKGYALGAPAVWRQYLGTATIHAEGLRLTIHLTDPMADLLDVLVQGFIVSPASFARMDAGDLTAMAGSGPYRVAEVAAGRVRLAPCLLYTSRCV